MSTNPSGSDRCSRRRPPAAAVPAGSSSRPSGQGKVDPKTLLGQICRLVTDDLAGARELAVQAAARFPGHEGLRCAKRILSEGEASRSKRGLKPDRSADLKWLSNPPESVRGQWVALVGGDLVGASDSLSELVADLRDRGLTGKALVHLAD